MGTGSLTNMADPMNTPLPGENFTSDRRNYPWHRPPNITNLNDGIEELLNSLGKKRAAQSVLTMLEIGLPISFISQLILMKGVGLGKWTLDLALLLAGPLSHILVITARKYDLDYTLGLETTEDLTLPTAGVIKKLREYDPEKQEEIEEEVVDEVAGDEPIGFMGMLGDQEGESDVAEAPQPLQNAAASRGFMQGVN